MSFKLAELNYAQVRASPWEVAVLPLGCTEPHNLHLPYGTDTFEADVIGERICAQATAGGARVLLLPTIPYGTTTNQSACPLSINVHPSTLFGFVSDIIASLAGHGVRKVLLLNSHGGNDFKPLLRELHGRQPASRVFLCNWYQMVADVSDRIFAQRDDHAGEMETSIALAYFPGLVARNPDGTLTADAGAKAVSRFEALERGWVSVTRPWHLLTTNTGAGDPHAATADKGRQVVDLIVARLAPFLVELSASPLDERFPY